MGEIERQRDSARCIKEPGGSKTQRIEQAADA